jgi:hypothetical protein
MRCSSGRSSPKYCREAYCREAYCREAWDDSIFDLPNKCDAAIEPSSQTNVGERLLHGSEVVGDDEG